VSPPPKKKAMIEETLQEPIEPMVIMPKPKKKKKVNAQ
jgi:hypothetical protein